jgi:hypothetical protein
VPTIKKAARRQAKGWQSFMAEIEKRRAKAPIPPAWSRAYLRPEEQNGDEVEECRPLTRE